KVSDGNIYSPYFRIDIEHQADISEEIARFYGYQNIPDRALSGVAVAALTDRQKYEKFVRDLMISCGLTQIETFTFISPSAYEKIRLPEDKRASVVITNPLGEDTGVMRTNALPSMMSILAGNYNHRNLEASLFELATEFIPLGGPDVLPLEQTSVVLGMYGENVDFYTLKGVVEELFIKSGVTEYDVRAVSDDPTFHPGRTAAMVVNGEDIAVLGEVHPAVAANYGIGVRVYAARISFDRLCELKNTEIEYAPLPKFPALSRDISFVIDRFTPVLYLSRLIKKAGGKSLESVRLFDVYQGGNIAADKKSVAFSLRFRGDGRTLTDEEADRAMADIVSALSSAGAVIRDK
ncbi:MAG: phenylalanine--tRNA ligase subunit beta, partial [Clostridia bacterium]|nr:phenylalanine--tRNA ligase subunit beta [Clostridia bacterium]